MLRRQSPFRFGASVQRLCEAESAAVGPGGEGSLRKGNAGRGKPPGGSLVEAGEGEEGRSAGNSREERKAEIPPVKERDFADKVGGEKQSDCLLYEHASPLGQTPGPCSGGGSWLWTPDSKS